MKPMDEDAGTPMNDGDPPEDRDLLILDDDGPFRMRLARAMEKRGFDVDPLETVAEAIARVRQAPPAYAVIDMRLEDGNGLDVIELIHELRPESRVIMLTGYGNIATAVC
jgi:two-component system response regulator RegA